MSQKAIIIGAGPAGLTAAYELLKRTDIKPIILEKSGDIGGISKTVNYKGNRIDIGGHRFFSKSDRVMQWWMNIMPIESSDGKETKISYQGKTLTVNNKAFNGSTVADPDKVMLVRKRLSRIYFLRKFFTYPIQLSFDTLKKLGFLRTTGILYSYLWARLFPRKPECSLEDFFINRFGRQLYLLFFKDYTEKVWGVSCQKISAEWGAQRIKGISIGKAIAHAVKSLQTRNKAKEGDIHQKNVETSLIERFLYPKYGPGQLWEEVAKQVQEMGGEIRMHCDVKMILTQKEQVIAVEAIDRQFGETLSFEGDYFFSTMPVKELIADLTTSVPPKVREVAQGLQYRDFITVGVLLTRLAKEKLEDTWIYIQEKDVKVGRVQLFNNWSPFMVKDPSNVWIGMEYFCNDGDAFWRQSDDAIKTQALAELEQMGLATVKDVLDTTVLRMEKTYPAYFGTYGDFDVIRKYIDNFANLFLIGRNGMHKYNNSDHSMLTAMVAVDNIQAGVKTKANIWEINSEKEYHEEKQPPASRRVQSPLKENIGNETFRDYLLRNAFNRSLLAIAGLTAVILIVAFKFLYPFPSFINDDSYVYLDMAYWNSPINTYPIGYPKFLRLFSVFSTSDIVLILFQYLYLMAGVLLFLFTVYYFFRPAKITQVVLTSIMVLNPLFLYLANYVSSDALFTSLSLLWITSLLWLVRKKSIQLLLLHGFILFLAFTVRYNALYYPLISTVIILFSHQRPFFKFTGIASYIILLGCFIFYTTTKYREVTGIIEFSPFSGWQIANNALFAYRNVNTSAVKPVPDKFRELDKTVRTYFDTTRNATRHPEETLLANTMYMWDPRSPLKKYEKKLFKNDSSLGSFKKWSTLGPLYSSYAGFLIKTYPTQFLEYYVWPNMLRYYAPPVEFLSTYGFGYGKDRDTVKQIAQTWFGYKTNKIKNHFGSYDIPIFESFPVLAGICNVVFLLGLIGFFVLKGYSQFSDGLKLMILISTLWFANFFFSVFASPIALRFQIFPLVVFLSFSVVFVEFLITEARKQEIVKNKPDPVLLDCVN